MSETDPEQPTVEQPIEVTLANAPFDKSNADLILRSSDNVDFRVFKVFLSTASPFFEAMFSLPEPATETESKGNDIVKDGLKVIPMPESSVIVEKLLMFCYPSWGTEPALGTLEEVQSLLEAATKYDMEDVRRRVQKTILAQRFYEGEIVHLRMFCIAVRYGLKGVAMAAMRHTKSYPVLGRPYVKELDHVSPRVYHQLLDYHWRCSTAAVSVTTELGWVPAGGWSSVDMVPECKNCAVSILSRRNGASKTSPSKYWTEYIIGARNVLKERPCSTSVLRADLIDTAKATAKKCPHCYPSAGVMMWQFTEAFAKEIEKATSAVSCTRPSSHF
jgi:hypothetical protein